MQVNQIYENMNAVTSEITGITAVIQEDLSNIVDVGKEILTVTDIDNYVKKLVNQIGRIIFVNRAYAGSAPSVLMDSWEFGSILEKIQAELPAATENESWELEDGASYDPNIFYKPVVSAKFFNSKVTFEVPLSFTEMQVKESLQSAAQLNGFLSMLYNSVDKAMTVKVDALVMRTINNMIGETVYAEFPSGGYGNNTGIRAVNLLKKFNDKFNAGQGATLLTAAEAITDEEFLRFASYEMGLMVDRLRGMSTLFNVGAKQRFTPSDMLHVIMLSEFKNAAGVYLYDAANNFNIDELKFPNAETVPFWQGSGQDYAFTSTSKINIVTSENHNIELAGVLAVMFDRDALGVTNYNRRTTTNYNPKAEFYTNWAKMDAGYFNDFNENFVVFYVADAA